MTTEKKKSIEVFQELYVRHPMGLKTLREALIKHARARWIHRPDHEEVLRESVGTPSGDPIAFDRPAVDALPGVTLWMFEDSEGYKVSNIVPMTHGSLGVNGYNEALVDFYGAVVSPAIKDAGLSVVLTTANQSIDDWTDAPTSTALKRFSRLANKSTGHSHPLDDERWQDFVIAAHRSDRRPDPSLLAQWLIEAEQWGEAIAHELAADYSNGLQLLTRYDSQSR
jgi:hypothetical protein